MREIKFRADVCGELKEVSAVYYCENDKCWWVCDGNIDLWDDWLRASFVNQYTGLKDKNGKEIYEGDIVRHYNMPQVLDVYKVAVVIYEDKRASFRKKNIGEDKTWAFGQGCHYEVIGNIYKNPELLEGKHE